MGFPRFNVLREQRERILLVKPVLSGDLQPQEVVLVLQELLLVFT